MKRGQIPFKCRIRDVTKISQWYKVTFGLVMEDILSALCFKVYIVIFGVNIERDCLSCDLPKWYLWYQLNACKLHWPFESLEPDRRTHLRESVKDLNEVLNRLFYLWCAAILCLILMGAISQSNNLESKRTDGV